MGNKWKHFLGQMFIPLNLSELDKHNQNPVEHRIQNLKSRLSKISNYCGVGVLAYHWEAIEYICSLNNYVAHASLGNCLPFEDFGGETPNISMIRFKFWEPVYYRDWTEKGGDVLMHPGRFIGFSWSVFDPMTFKVLQCNKDPKKRNMVFHRGFVVPRSLTTKGYNSALAPNSDTYFPDVRVEGGSTSKTAPSVHQGTVDTPNISMPDGGGKRHNL